MHVLYYIFGQDSTPFMEDLIAILSTPQEDIEPQHGSS